MKKCKTMQELSLEELNTINGGDGATRVFFYAVGFLSAIGERLFVDRPHTRLSASRPFE